MGLKMLSRIKNHLGLPLPVSVNIWLINDNRHYLRKTFNQSADLYDQIRPGYPNSLIDDVIAKQYYCQLTLGSNKR